MLDPRAPRPLLPEEIRRYSRHLLLPEVGPGGQRRLSESSVLLVGAGGLGSPAALYLAAAGVGEIGLVDADIVELSNLQRQVLYSSASVGKPKAAEAARRLSELNPSITVRPIPERLTSANALRVLEPYDVVLDGSDNFPTRYLVNDAAVLLGKPDVFGSVYRFEGQVSVFDARHGPCYRCLYSEPPPPGAVPSCAEGGVLGILPGIVGSLQASETLKLLLGVGEPLIGRLLLFDALSVQFRELRLSRSPTCPVCAPNPTQKGLIDYEAFCGVLSSGALAGREVSGEELLALLAGPVPPTLVDVRTPREFALSHLSGARSVPVNTLAEHAAELAASSSLVLYCASGERSARGVRLLEEMGFTGVRHLHGGLESWTGAVTGPGVL